MFKNHLKKDCESDKAPVSLETFKKIKMDRQNDLAKKHFSSIIKNQNEMVLPLIRYYKRCPGLNLTLILKFVKKLSPSIFYYFLLLKMTSLKNFF